jgi:hypothetical protein
MTAKLRRSISSPVIKSIGFYPFQLHTGVVKIAVYTDGILIRHRTLAD